MSGPGPEREPEYGRCWPVTGNQTGEFTSRGLRGEAAILCGLTGTDRDVVGVLEADGGPAPEFIARLATGDRGDDDALGQHLAGT